MARAKKTDRAEARRRARVAAAESADTSENAPAADGSSGAGGGTAARVGASAAPAQRPSLTGQFRSAIRPVNLRQDLRDIPWLVTRTPAIALPSLIIVVSAIWYGVSGVSDPRSLPAVAFQVSVYPPPQVVPAFLAGLLAPRMTYLAGGIVGLVCALVFTIFMLVSPDAATLAADARVPYILAAWTISPISAMAIGGFAGFYRRFLRTTNPNRRNQAAKSKSSKSATRR